MRVRVSSDSIQTHVQMAESCSGHAKRSAPRFIEMEMETALVSLTIDVIGLGPPGAPHPFSHLSTRMRQDEIEGEREVNVGTRLGEADE